MLKLGSKVFFIDFGSGIGNAVVCGENVNETGFDTVSLKTSDGHFVVVHRTLVYETLEEAEKDYAAKKPINDEIKRIAIEANEKQEALLEQITGKPEFYNLTVKFASEQAKKQ